ncbi:hypothetical protein ACSBR2_005355 [Camellia fascicularis]
MADEDEHSTSSSSSNSCPICLGPLLQESYLDQCFHKFRYNCIVHWTKVVAYKLSRAPSSVKCPLCRTENFSIIHGYDGTSFERHYINQDFGNSLTFIVENVTLLLYIASVVLSFQKLTNIGYSATILNQEEDVETIVHHIRGVIDSFRRNYQKSPTTPKTKQEHFKALVSQAATPFLIGRTDQFVNEVELFLASGLNIEAYDKVYMQHLGWKVSGITTEDEDGEVSGNASFCLANVD